MWIQMEQLDQTDISCSLCTDVATLENHAFIIMKNVHSCFVTCVWYLNHAHEMHILFEKVLKSTIGLVKNDSMTIVYSMARAIVISPGGWWHEGVGEKRILASMEEGQAYMEGRIGAGLRNPWERCSQKKITNGRKKNCNK